MEAVASLYQSQPFWIWLAIAALILAIESVSSTEWLLWPAVAAGVVALMTLAAPQLGMAVEIAVFAVLTLIGSIASRRLVKRVNPTEPDINDRNARLVGARAEVVEAFVDGRGRVFVSGSEWPADLEGEAPEVGGHVTVQAVSGPRLTVRA